MADVEATLDAAGVTNPNVREYVRYYAELTGAERVEVVSAADDARLIQEALDAGELDPAGDGLYYSRSYHKDTARSEERTIVATSDPKDKGLYNNWKPSSEMKPRESAPSERAISSMPRPLAMSSAREAKSMP